MKTDVYNIANSIRMNNSIKGLTATADYSVRKLQEMVESNIKVFFRVNTNSHSGERTLSLRVLPDDFRRVLDSVVKTHGNEDMKLYDFEQYLI